jgi:hypothetical protein
VDVSLCSFRTTSSQHDTAGTAGFMLTVLAVPAWCSFMMEYDVHTVLDMLTLVATAAVIYQLRVKLVDTYQDDQDSVKTYYVVRMPLA